jgi:hypothetical protein
LTPSLGNSPIRGSIGHTPVYHAYNLAQSLDESEPVFRFCTCLGATKRAQL